MGFPFSNLPYAPRINVLGYCDDDYYNGELTLNRLLRTSKEMYFFLRQHRIPILKQIMNMRYPNIEFPVEDLLYIYKARRWDDNNTNDYAIRKNNLRFFKLLYKRGEYGHAFDNYVEKVGLSGHIAITEYYLSDIHHTVRLTEPYRFLFNGILKGNHLNLFKWLFDNHHYIFCQVNLDYIFYDNFIENEIDVNRYDNELFKFFIVNNLVSPSKIIDIFLFHHSINFASDIRVNVYSVKEKFTELLEPFCVEMITEIFNQVKISAANNEISFDDKEVQVNGNTCPSPPIEQQNNIELFIFLPISILIFCLIIIFIQ